MLKIVSTPNLTSNSSQTCMQVFPENLTSAHVEKRQKCTIEYNQLHRGPPLKSGRLMSGKDKGATRNPGEAKDSFLISHIE